MDFDKNVDQLYFTGLPKYGQSDRVSGLQFQFDDSYYIEPWDIQDFKDFARIDTDTDDNLLALFLKSARITVEQYLQKSLGVRTVLLFATKLPKNYLLPWGPVDTILTDGFTNFGDILREGGTDVELEYTTSGLINDTILTAIYKQAYGLYENRDKYRDPKFASGLIDEVKRDLAPFKRLQWP